MDKEEAERLKSAIEQARITWIQVEEIVLNTTKDHYELRCVYREQGSGLFFNQEAWRPRWIVSPRDWVHLLARHRDLS